MTKPEPPRETCPQCESMKRERRGYSNVGPRDHEWRCQNPWHDAPAPTPEPRPDSRLAQYRKAIDDIYNDSEIGRNLVIKHFGTLHPEGETPSALSAEQFWYSKDVQIWPWGKSADHDAIFKFSEAYAATLREKLSTAERERDDLQERLRLEVVAGKLTEKAKQEYFEDNKQLAQGVKAAEADLAQLRLLINGERILHASTVAELARVKEALKDAEHTIELMGG